MDTAITILELEKSCEKIIAATANQDWESVATLDSGRSKLIDSLGSLQQENLTVEMETRINRILDLDRIIQQTVIEAWNKAKADLLTVKNARPALEMYQQS